MTYKLKPCWNFQSIEITIEETDYMELDDVIKLYKDTLNRLIEISPEQSTGKKSSSVPQVELATPAQKETMDRYGIPYDNLTTKAEATKKIKESYGI